MKDLLPLEYYSPVSAGDIVGYLRCKRLVVHQQQVDLPDIGNEQLLESVWQQVSCLEYRVSARRQTKGLPHLFVRTIANLWHWGLTLETTPDSVVDTLGFPPCLLHAMVPVRLVPFERLCSLFNNLNGRHLSRSQLCAEEDASTHKVNGT